MTWKSLDELRQEFQIPLDMVDRDEIRAELRRQLAALHPDKTGGKFASAEQESRYFRLSEALAYLDGDLPVPVVLQGMTAKLQVIENRLAVWQSARDQGYTATMDSEAAKAVERLVAVPYRLPRIGSAAFAAVCIRSERLDTLAALTAPLPPDWDMVRETYEADDALRVPSVVTSQGKQVAVEV